MLRQDFFQVKVLMYFLFKFEIVSGSVTCVLIPGTKPLIQVDNFQEVSESTFVSISFPGILKNPSTVTSYTVKMKTIKLANRVRTELNSRVYTLSSTGVIVAGFLFLSYCFV